jgi:choline dehydrogenase-like flavoprotein
MLYDAKFHYQNPAVAAYGTRIAAQLALKPEIVEQEQLLNCHVWFSSLFFGEDTEAAETLRRIRRTLSKMEQPGSSLGQDLAALMANPIDTLGFGFSRQFRPRQLIKSIRLQAIVEPEPNPDSCVTLSCERDQLGMNRVRVIWKLGSAVQRTFNRTFTIVADDLRRNGIADIALDPALEGGSWPETLESTSHHMGTTRMHDSPRYGVVDRNCRVHSVNNLYIAGSSVFPTGGTNFPTITIVALALRLSDHVANELQCNTWVGASGLASAPLSSRVPAMPGSVNS